MWGAAMVTALVASVLMGSAVDWIVPWNREQLIRPFAITAIYIGLYLQFVILLAKSVAKNDSARRLFLMKSLTVCFASMAGGEIAQILWTLKGG
jgi:hypothetical protein